ncbi:hypothetical protein DTO166G4_574 [Paecilomyces variotii]|nr:hypothetical protein DTO166G4_574 [Paecilomyces variotii]KAJ9221945.1 hypothetical protein DTO169C6_5739 [Paecilomyces variotii]KAJ9350108.1 hypothetical protein DTO027B9_7128 [Paecilomyces variotii]
MELINKTSFFQGTKKYWQNVAHDSKQQWKGLDSLIQHMMEERDDAREKYLVEFITSVRLKEGCRRGGPGAGDYVWWAQQRHVCSTDFRDRSKLARRSESAVNMSLISFLQALAMVAGLPANQWNGDRIPLQADFGGPAGSFIAVTDGQLQSVTDKRILALVECKRWERHRYSPQVELQETAQMVSWIKEFSDPVRRPWQALVSQDGKETYVSIFEYDWAWESYINGSPRPIKKANLK